MDRRLRTAFLSLLALVSGVAVTIYANSVLSLDAFARFRTRPGDQLDPVSIRLADFDIRHWSGGRLTTFAHVDRMEVGRNQNFYELFGVTKGQYAGAEEPFEFTAAHATWTQTRRALEGFQDVRVKNARYDLHGNGFLYEPDRRLLTVSGTVTGTYEGAKLVAKGVTYNEATREFKTGPFEIQTTDPDDDDKSHVWRFSGGTGGSTKGDIQTVINLRATDGIVVVRAPKAYRNTKTDVLTCEGPVRYWSPKADSICDHAVIYRREKRAVLTGRVTMVLKAKDHQVVDEKVVVVPFAPLKPDEVTPEAPPTPNVEHRQSDAPAASVPTSSAPTSSAPTASGTEPATTSTPSQEIKNPAKDSHPAKTMPSQKGPVVALPTQKSGNQAESPDERRRLDDELRSDETVRKYPATLYADQVEYFYGKGNRHGIATGSPQAQQELPGKRWRRVWAHHALYNGEKETLRLMPANSETRVRVKSSVGDDFLTTFFELSTQEGNNDQSYGPFDGQFISEDEEANQAARKAGDKDQGKPTKPGPGTKSGSGAGSGASGTGGTAG
jgi:hypothetical protein